MAGNRRRKRVPRNRRIYRLAVLPAALLLAGVAGASYSQAQASQSSCSTQGGLLSVATGALCETLGSATTVTKPADGTATGTGSGLTGTVGSVVGSVTGTVGSVAGGVTGTVGSVVGDVTGTVGSVAGSVTGGSNSAATSSGSPGGSSGGTSGGSSGSSGSSLAGTGSSGSTGPVAGSVQPQAGPQQPAAGAAARARRAALTASLAALAASRAALIGQLPRRLGLTAVPGTALSIAPSVRIGPSQPPATRQLTHSLLPRSLWLLIAAACGLAGGIGLVYSGWRNFDLVRRRRAAARRYAC